jgi:hypothetical protein
VVQEKLEWIQPTLFGLIHYDRRFFIAGVTIRTGSFGKQKLQYLFSFGKELALFGLEGIRLNRRQANRRINNVPRRIEKMPLF